MPSIFQGAERLKQLRMGRRAAKAFEDLKQYIEKLAVMSSPSEKAELMLYISTSGAAVSAALVEERMVEGALTQAPIYFVSEALNGSKLLYLEMEKMAYAVVMELANFVTTSRATKSRFQPLSHFGICLRTEKPPAG